MPCFQSELGYPGLGEQEAVLCSSHPDVSVIDYQS